MKSTNWNRRTFMQATAATLAATATSATASDLFIATNTYPWGTFFGREKKNFPVHSDEMLAAIAASGIKGYEAAYNGVGEFDGLAERLAEHGLSARSMYVNSQLHDDQWEKSIASVLALAEQGKKLGINIVVTNPSPLAWGGTAVKSDTQLETQAKALDTLGAALRERGQTLAYHNHDAELRAGGREFHHMLTATKPENLHFCLDAHWVFRGCQDSQVALFDAVAHYGSRIVELHVRQSTKGIWDEVFKPGDIDYPRLVKWLVENKLKPLVCLEQCIEGNSPNTLEGIPAHQQSLAYAREVFAPLA